MSRSKRFWVVFKDAERRNWIARWLRPGFGHVFVLHEVLPNVMLMVDGGETVLNVLVAENCAWNWIKTSRLAGYRVVVVETTVREGGYFRGWPIWSCVAVAARAIGMNTWAVTPWQLYRQLIAQGHTDLEDVTGG